MKRNHVYVSSAIVCLLSALILLALAAPVSVTPTNIVLKDGSGGISVTTVYCASVQNGSLDGYVQVYRMLVENGSAFPSVASSGFLFFRTDWNMLTFYNGTDWTNCTTVSGSGMPSTYPYANLTGVPDTFPYDNLTGVPSTFPYANLTGPPDLSVYLLTSSASNFLFQNGTRELTADWNTGAYGVYGATWLNSTSLNALGFYWNGLNRTDAVANPISTASYIIDVSGSNYRMKNGTTGQFDFVSTNASAVINNAIGNCSNGGTVFLKKGNYALQNYTVLTGTSNLVIVGESWGTVLNATGNGQSLMLYCTSANNLTISNLAIEGAYVTNPTVYLHGVSGLVFDRVFLYRTSPHVGTGNEMTDVPSMATFEGNHITVSNCRNLNSWGYGFIVENYVDNSNMDITFAYNTVESCHFNSIALYGCSYFNVVGNIINGTSPSGHSGITVSPARHGTIFANTIRNIWRWNSSVEAEGGIELENGHVTTGEQATYDITISGNSISNCTAGVILRVANGKSTPHDINFFGNTILNCSTIGFYMVNGDNINIAGNVVAYTVGTLASSGAIHIYSGATNCMISENIVHDNAYWGISVYGTNVTVQNNQVFNSGEAVGGSQAGIAIHGCNNTIQQNRCYDTRSGASRTQQYGIYLYSDGNDNYVWWNIFQGNSIAQVGNVGSRNIIKSNVGFVTENTGSSVNATATTFSITHGLASTPTFVSYSFNSTDITAASWTSTTTVITVTVVGMASANYTCYWSAIYTP